MNRELGSEVQTPWLEHFPEGGGQVQRTPLSAETTIIGRAESADLQIDSSRVSREHARIVARDGKYVLQDLGSTNGTFVNGERIDRKELSDGDVILIADTDLTFLLNAVSRLRRMATQPLHVDAAGPRRGTHSSKRDYYDAILGVRQMHEELMQQLAAVELKCVVEQPGGAVVARVARPLVGNKAVIDRNATMPPPLKRLGLRRMQTFRAIAIERCATLSPSAPLMAPIESWEASDPGETHWRLEELRESLPSGGSLAVCVKASDAVDVPKVRELCERLHRHGFAIACHEFIGGEAQVRDLDAIGPSWLLLAAEMTRGVYDDQRQLRRLTALGEACRERSIRPVVVSAPTPPDLSACLESGLRLFVQDDAGSGAGKRSAAQRLVGAVTLAYD